MTRLPMQDMMCMMQSVHEKCRMMGNMKMGNMEMGSMGMMGATQSSMQEMEDCSMMGEDTMEQKAKKSGEATSPEKEDGEGDFRD